MGEASQLNLWKAYFSNSTYENKVYILKGIDLGTAEVVRTHTAQDNPCGIGRSQPPAEPQLPVPQIASFFA